MLLSLVAIIAGLALLVWSADRFVEGAAATAQNLGISTLVIGITIIGFGTSAPEILISVFSVIDNTPNLAIGNALGSNIANIGLILGVTALFIPLHIASRILLREFPILILASLLLTWALYDTQLDFIDGLLLMGLLIAGLAYLVHYSRQDKDDALSSELEQEIPHDMPTKLALTWVVVGLLVLVGSSKLLVWGAVNIAVMLGISELIIGLTIVALGTSLPELAAAIAGARKGEPDMVLGNVVGSNIFNLGFILGGVALVRPIATSGTIVKRDGSVLILSTFLLLFLFLDLRESQTVSRIMLN